MSAANNFSGNAFDSPSSYPPSTPSLGDSDDETLLPPTTKAAFRSSLASVSESTLRSIVAKLADSNPYFQNAIMRELSHLDTDSAPTTPITPKRMPRRKNRRNRKNLLLSTTSSSTHQRRSMSLSSDSPSEPDDSLYHPGGTGRLPSVGARC